MRGNVMDMAIGIILGGAFGKIVASAVTDLIMPPIGLLLGGVDFKALAFTLKQPVIEAGGKVAAEAVQIRYGAFLSTVIDFILIPFAISVGIKALNSVKKPEPEPTEKQCDFCRTTVPIGATRCPHGTSTLDAPPRSGSSPPSCPCAGSRKAAGRSSARGRPGGGAARPAPRPRLLSCSQAAAGDVDEARGPGTLLPYPAPRDARRPFEPAPRPTPPAASSSERPHDKT